MTKARAAISWSGGKDSCAALLRTCDTFSVETMVTMFDEDAQRSRSHGLRPEVVAAQASRLGLNQAIGRCTWRTYDAVFLAQLTELKAAGISHVIFGDILFEEHRAWAESMCEAAGLTAVEPLWGLSTEVLFHDWVTSGADALIVTVRAERLDEGWLGQRLSAEHLPLLTGLGVDPCGERGEYHTVVTNCSLFRKPIRLHMGERVQRADCWAIDATVGTERTGPGS